MAGVTDTQSLRFGQVTDVITHTMQMNLADDIATQLDNADAARLVAQKRPVAHARRSAALALPAVATTAIIFDQELTDTHAMIDIPTQPTRITVGATAGTGIYLVQIYVSAFTSTWTREDVMLLRNGTIICQKTWIEPEDLAFKTLSMLVAMTATTDFFTMASYHESGGTTNSSSAGMRVWKVTA